MTTMPGVRFAPLGPQTQPRSAGHNIICIHTMVGSLEGTDSFFRAAGYTGNESHYGTSGTGEIRQWQNNAWTADANYQGSREIVSIENADHGVPFAAWNTAGDNVPPFTPAQAEANARIMAWESTPLAHRDCPPAALCHRFGIPLVLIPNTLPGTRGVGYHAQGVPGNGLVPGGVVWSQSRGKVCPGRHRIAQIPGIIARAIVLRNNPGEDIVTPEDRKAIAAEVWGYIIARRGNIGPASAEQWLAHAAQQSTTGADLSQRTDRTVEPMPAALAALAATGDDVQAKLGEQAASITTAVVAAIEAATGGSVDAAVVRAAVQEAVSRLQITLPDDNA